MTRTEQLRPYREILEAWERGEELEILHPNGTTSPRSNPDSIPTLTVNYRIKPKNITITARLVMNGHYYEDSNNNNIQLTFTPTGVLLEAKVLK